VAEFCSSGAIDRSIETVKAALRERRDATCAALERDLPDASFTPPQGGYFLWVDLPDEADVAELEDRAKERDVVFVPGTDFLIEGGDSSLRMSYSGVSTEEIDEGISRLGEAYKELAGAAAA
jgi:2-aminoadipate transaminase